MLELAILGLLKEHPMHGYDLRKRLRGDFGLLSSLSFGSLYPALARLEATGAVHEVSALGGTREAPSPGAFTSAGSIAGERAAFRARLASRRAAATRSSAGTRGRRVYELTARGEELFQQLLENEEPKPEGGRGFALRWAFARYLSPEARLSLLQRRRAQLLDAREGSRRAVESPWRPLDRYQRSLVDHAKEATEHDLSWIDRLIAAEEASQLPPPAPEDLPARPTQALVTNSEVVNAAAVHASPTLVDTLTERSEP
ncbi:MAG: helix-turn-helix transcriptional regulator [Acidimicrobiales bacterium]|jgi:DNA-binding PadR family transcriptional regulator